MALLGERISEVGEAFGWPWVPVKFCRTAPKVVAKELRFCEAIKEARRSPVVLTADTVVCAGARRSFGWSQEPDERLAEQIAEKQGTPLAVAKRMISNVPRLENGFAAVEVGAMDRADVFVSYAQPVTAMRIARAIERFLDKPLSPRLTSVLSACGSVAARCFITGEVAISFGCEDSRDCGSISRDRLIIGIPWVLVPKLLGLTEAGSELAGSWKTGTSGEKITAEALKR